MRLLCLQLPEQGSGRAKPSARPRSTRADRNVHLRRLTTVNRNVPLERLTRLALRRFVGVEGIEPPVSLVPETSALPLGNTPLVETTGLEPAYLLYPKQAGHPITLRLVKLGSLARAGIRECPTFL